MHRQIPLPRAWNRRTKAAILQILALSHYTFTAMVARASNGPAREDPAPGRDRPAEA